MNKDVIHILRNAIIDIDFRAGYKIEIYKLPSAVINWPSVPDETGYPEPLELENWEILKITDVSFVMCCGGDLQDPRILTMVPENDKLKVIMSVEGYENGMRTEDILRIFEDLDATEHSDYGPGDRFKPGD